MKPLIPLDRVNVFFDGIFTEPQLNHSECVVLDHDENIWCGGEQGEIFRITADGSQIEMKASTGGFILGMAFDTQGHLYICDLKHAKIFRYRISNGELQPFSILPQGLSMVNPNYPVVDEQRSVLYVSDSYKMGIPAPGIWKFDLHTGDGELWYDEPLNFANGMALSSDGTILFIAETYAEHISVLTIDESGNPSKAQRYVQLPPSTHPDGLVLDEKNGFLYITCYQPSRVYRVKLDRSLEEQTSLELVVDDPAATTLCHPTNGALSKSGDKLYLANLGRWHISQVLLNGG